MYYCTHFYTFSILLYCSVYAVVMGFHCGMTAPCCRAQEETGQEVAEPVVEKMLKDEIIRLTNIKASAKIRSVWRQSRGRTNAKLKSTANNSLTLISSVPSQMGGMSVLRRW